MDLIGAAAGALYNWIGYSVLMPWLHWVCCMPNLLLRLVAFFGSIFLAMLVVEMMAAVPVIGWPFKAVRALFRASLWVLEHFIMIFLGVVIVFAAAQFLPGLMALVGMGILGLLKR